MAGLTPTVYHIVSTSHTKVLVNTPTVFCLAGAQFRDSAHVSSSHTTSPQWGQATAAAWTPTAPPALWRHPSGRECAWVRQQTTP